jgi:hypothetical protein
VLVAAVLRPEQGEDRELEVVGLPLEQREDTVELPVGEAEGPVERLLDDRAQTPILAPVDDDGPSAGRVGRMRGGAAS